jgi:phasin family protein
MDRLVILQRVINISKGFSMSTLPEQFSAARSAQIDAQLQFFQNYAATAVENAEQLLSLNVSTTRASMEKSSAAVRQLLAARDPRDLLALTTQTQAHFESMLAYGRQLFSIASGAQARLLKQAAPVIAPPVPELPTAVKAPVVKLVAPEAAPPDSVPAAKVTPAAPPAAKARPIAKAVSKVGAKAVPAKPAAAPFPSVPKPVVVTSLKAVEASPPPTPVSGKPAAEPKQLDMLAPKPKKKSK